MAFAVYLSGFIMHLVLLVYSRPEEQNAVMDYIYLPVSYISCPKGFLKGIVCRITSQLKCFVSNFKQAFMMVLDLPKFQ